MSLIEEQLIKESQKFDPTTSKNKPVRVQCISAYLAMADDGLIALEPGEYAFYKLRLHRLASRSDVCREGNQPFSRSLGVTNT